MSANAGYIIMAAHELGFEVAYTYSNAGLCGRSCIGIYFDDFASMGRVMFQLGGINEQEDVLDMTQEIFNYRYNRLGKGYIMFWPFIECSKEQLDEADEDIEEEEEEEDEGPEEEVEEGEAKKEKDFD